MCELSRRRRELLAHARRQPQEIVDHVLGLEAKVRELERRLAQNNANISKPPSTDGLQ